MKVLLQLSQIRKSYGAQVILDDATATFGRRDHDGVWRTAAEVHAMSLANLAPPQNLWPKDGNSWSTSGGVFVVDAQDDK